MLLSLLKRALDVRMRPFACHRRNPLSDVKPPIDAARLAGYLEYREGYHNALLRRFLQQPAILDARLPHFCRCWYGQAPDSEAYRCGRLARKRVFRRM